MHRQFSHSTIWSLRLGSLHFIANIFILILGTFLLTMGVITHTDKYALYGFLGLSLGVISVMFFKLCWLPRRRAPSASVEYGQTQVAANIRNPRNAWV